jgi:hypothetical protein
MNSDHANGDPTAVAAGKGNLAIDLINKIWLSALTVLDICSSWCGA